MNIDIRKLKKYYGSTLILDIPSFSFKKGMIYSLVGSNGAGKSTLLKLIYKLENPTSGDISADIERIAFNPQFPFFLKGNSEYNLTEPFRLRNIPVPKEKMNELIKRFDLDKLRKSHIEGLSGGEKAKIQFIRTILYDKDFILLDEPAASMDKKSSLILEEVLMEMKELGKGIIIITHNPAQAERISDFIIELDEGKIV